MRRGNLQLLCSDCNSNKGAKPNPPYITVNNPNDFSYESPDFV
jgi:5-methylcytosine-specific restriction endonuclease McrA